MMALSAWPARESRELDGWQLRRHTVPSRRVNSVWPNAWGGAIPLAVKLEKVEAYYAAENQPARYQICPAALPQGLDDVLEARGYRVDAPTAVQVAQVENVLEASQAYARVFENETRISEKLSMDWVAAYCEVQGAPESEAGHRRSALGLVERPSIYVQIDLDDKPVAVGRGVLDDQWLGIFSMATHERYRRRGLATAVIHALSGWGQGKGVKNLYLQVMDVNTGALALYSNLGFETLYHYHYRYLKN